MSKLQKYDLGKADPVLIVTRKYDVEGMIAAWISKKAFKENMVWHEIEEGQNIPDVSGKDVLMFGIVFQREVMDKMEKCAKSLQVFENDRNSVDKVSGARYIRWDFSSTAGRMAWNYFKLEAMKDSWLIDYTLAPQRWKWPHLNNYLIQTAISNIASALDEDDDFALWEVLAARDLFGLVNQGKEILDKERKPMVSESSMSSTVNEKEKGGADVTKKTKKKAEPEAVHE